MCHCHALAGKEEPYSLKNALDEAIKIVNFYEILPLEYVSF